MQPEEKEMLEKTLKLAEENNEMLHSIRRGLFWAKVMRMIYWIIIIGIAVGAFYFITPYIDSALETYGDVKGTVEDFGDLLQ
jgi:hypothetical protein